MLGDVELNGAVLAVVSVQPYSDAYAQHRQHDPSDNAANDGTNTSAVIAAASTAVAACSSRRVVAAAFTAIVVCAC